jgi:hypothetical protein
VSSRPSVGSRYALKSPEVRAASRLPESSSSSKLGVRYSARETAQDDQGDELARAISRALVRLHKQRSVKARRESERT